MCKESKPKQSIDPSPSLRPAPVLPAATLVLLRDGATGLKVLILRRGYRLSAFAGAWVFPGGGVEPCDGNAAASFQSAARNAAVRELREETGLTVPAAALLPLSRWTAPVVMPRRFDTWFFMAPAPRDAVRVDGGEIHAHRWASPREILQDHRAGRVTLFPPTWVTLYHLTAFERVATAMAAAADRVPFHYAPRVVKRNKDTCYLYGGDQAYANLQVDVPGRRHRLWTRGRDWRYECTRKP